jgi:hypothetical protein
MVAGHQAKGTLDEKKHGKLVEGHAMVTALLNTLYKS